jgi:hypothetical protein
MALRSTTFVNSVSVRSSSSQVFAVLSEPKQMMGLQPFIVGCDILSAQTDAQRGTAEYEVYFIERFTLAGPLRYDNRIHTFIRSSRDEKRVVFLVRSFPRVSLESTFVLTDADGSTQVDQTVIVTTPGIMHSFVVGVAQKAQRKLLENLQQRCASLTKSSG